MCFPGNGWCLIINQADSKCLLLNYLLRMHTVCPFNQHNSVPQHPVSSAIEQEKDQMRRKLSSLREDNSSLVSQNHCLVNEIESVRYELTQSKNKIRYLESNIDANAQSVPQLKEHILGLESEVEAQEKALRDAEEKLEECQWMVAEKDKFVEKLTDECSRLKNDLFERSKRGKRTEQQRNEALFNAEEISATFKEYKEKTTEKLSRVRVHGLRVVQKDLEAKNAEMFSLLSHAKEKIVMLERELANKEALLKDRDALRMENVELRSLTACQSDRLLQYCKEVENAKSECRNLESIMQLQRKGNPEVTLKKIYTPVVTSLRRCFSLSLNLEFSTYDRKSQEPLISNYEEERHRNIREVEELQTRLLEAEATISTLQARMTQKINQFQQLQEELLEKNSYTANIEQEVSKLEAALALCNEELKAQVQQMKGERTHFEKQQSKRSEEVRHLQKDLKLSTINLQETSEQNVQFQQSLKQHQQMLQQGTTRIGELEDCQMMLERQVSKLEQELQKQKGLSGEELAKAEEKLYQACRDAEYKKQQVTDLNNTMKKLKIEMNECKNEFTALETELLQLRRDSASNEIQLNQLEMSLRETQIELEKNLVTYIAFKEILKRLHKTEAERKNSLQQNQEMDLHLKNMRGELQGTLNQLQELRDVLQKAQNSIDDKNDTIEQLTTEFRECQNELQKRDKEVYDMDQALKDRQRELKQRAAQLTQLDLNIHEHKTETEQKIIRLQGALEKAELIVKERSKQVEILDENLQITKDQLREREFELLQKEQQINQLKSDVEGKHQRIEEYEQVTNCQCEQCIAKQHQEVLGEGQQVRLARELMQRTHLELTEARQQLAQAQREMDYLTRELNETIQLSHEKEARAAHLAEELGAAQARETQLEVRAQAEINKFKEMVESLKDTHQKEISLLKERQAPLSLFSGQISETSKSSGPSTIDNFLQTNEALEDAQGKILNLQKELQAQNEEMHATNEALIIKVGPGLQMYMSLCLFILIPLFHLAIVTCGDSKAIF
uniref:Coiled-coil domain containing 18 n=1 Tax=Callorhinchus milii TaxID=7868 RepID=A0A4W3HIY4_CALMI